jgi:23S rRNA (cytosine1962-C5)-methyltransferase
MTSHSRKLLPSIFFRDPQARMRSGHPWIYATQVLRSEGRVEPGDLVRVVDVDHGPVGVGYANPLSMIRVRMLSSNPEARVDGAFFHARIQRAYAHRRSLGYSGSMRVVFGESDDLPGLVVDKFNDLLSVQVLTAGMDRWKDDLVAALREVVRPTGIYERSDVAVREREGLQLVKGFLGAPFHTLTQVQHDQVRMEVDVATGQKTGHFLDQVRNHAAMAQISSGANVLDCCTHTGGFALHAAAYGAAKVLAIDLSASALEIAGRNAELNGLQATCTFQEANVFDLLADADRKGLKWEVIVLDPPAFAKNRATLGNAQRGYKEINLRAMRCLVPGGFLVTCSCSFHMQEEQFARTIAEAALDAGRTLVQVYTGGQPPDHPVRWGFPESHYLKCHILQVR